MIYFICGQSCAGKSYFIKENFKKNIELINLYDFQHKDAFTIGDIYISYKECQNELIKQITNLERNNKDIVLEHTMLKAIRRKEYIDAIHKVTKEPICIYFINYNIFCF